MIRSLLFLLSWLRHPDASLLAQNAAFHAAQIADSIARYNARALVSLRIKP
jgi:hypothetical protein